MKRLLLVIVLTLACGCGARAASPSGEPLPLGASAATFLERGRAFAAAGDVVRAEQYFAAALAAGAREETVMPPLLGVCIAAKHYRLASEYAEVALAKNPGNPRLRFLVGALYYSTGDRARARDALERSARELPRDADLQFAVAVFFRDEMGDPFAADGYFREYLRLQPQGAHAEEARASLVEHVE